MGEQATVPSKQRQTGPDARPVGEWVLGETVFPSAAQDRRWQGYVQQDKSGLSMSNAVMVYDTAGTMTGSDK